MVVAKKDSKSLDVNCRHSSVLTGIDRHKMSTARQLFLRLLRVHNLFLANADEDSALAIREYIERVIIYYNDVSTVPHRIYVRYGGDVTVYGYTVYGFRILRFTGFRDFSRLPRIS